jgi:hypothetical protein
MKRTITIVVIVLIMISSTGCRARRLAKQAAQTAPAEQPAQAVPQSQAQPPAAPAGGSNILFQDDFQDGNSDGWVITSGWTVNQDGEVYTFGTQVAGGAYVKSGGASDYIYSARLKLDTGVASLIFRWSKAGRYLVQVQPELIYLIKEAPTSTYNIMLQAPVSGMDQWHTFSIAIEGGHIQVSIEQALVLDFTDPIPLGRGTIGVGASDSTSVSVDDVLVSRLQQSLAPASPPAQAQPAPQQAPAVIAAPPVDESFEIEDIPEPQVIEEVEEDANQEQPESPPENPSLGGHPDLTIRRLDLSKTSVSKGEPLRVSVVVLNSGNAVAGAFTTAWLPDQRSSIIGCSWDINRLEEGQECDLSCDYPGYPQAGEFSSMAYADAEMEIAESSETNNEQRGSVTVQGGANGEPGEGNLPDLMFSAATHPDSVTFRETVKFVLQVVNIGTAPAGAFTVLFIPDINTGVVACSFDYAGLAVNETQRFNCSYVYIDIGTFTFRNTVDSESDVVESNENNNVDSGTIEVKPITQ